MIMVNEMLPIRWKELYLADFDFLQPFALPLADNEIFAAEEIFRIVPKRRVVAAGSWRGKAVVAKIFFQPGRAKHHMEKEVAGFNTLKYNKIPTPPLLYYGLTADNRISILIFQRIFGANNLHDIWVNKTDIRAVQHKMRATVVELATQHVLGIMQQDLHLKNFLLSEKVIYTLDPAQVTSFPEKLNQENSMRHLALFLSQMGIGYEVFQKQLFQHYAKARGWLLRDDDYVELFLMIKKWNESRWLQFSKKIFRASSEFACQKSWSVFCAYQRKFAASEFQQFLQDPEMAFRHSSCQILKAGRSATVVKVVLDGREVVVKRYNLKNIWHRLRRLFRMSRAASAWRIAHKLLLFNIPTARPLAFIEKRFLGMRGTAYYATEFVRGGECRDLLMKEGEQRQALIERISALLQDLAKLTITHGDLKLNNILFNEQCHPVLIDLDGTREHASLSSLRAAWRKEIKRFLRNFDKKSSLYAEFKLRLDS